MWKIVLVCDRTGAVHETGILGTKREAIESSYCWTRANNDSITAIAIPDGSRITFTARPRGIRLLGKRILRWTEE